MKILMSHPTGNANVREAAIGFSKAGMLLEFDTAIATFPGTVLERLSFFGPFSEFRRRSFDPILKDLTNTFPWRELGRLTASKTKMHNLIRHEEGIFSIDAVYQSLDKQVGKRLKYKRFKQVSGIYAYEDGAAFSFNQAKQLKIQCLYDLPTGHWRAARQLLKSESDNKPEWAITLTGFKDSDDKLERKDQELLLANTIFVASSFTAETLKSYPGTLSNINVIPYGFPEVNENRDYSIKRNNQPLKLIFVGRLTQQKGIAYLFEAIEKLGNSVELTVVGHKVTNDCKPLNAALQKHRWIQTLSHAAILKLMKENDVLIFPSLFDGFGLVITEAMSQGTPVIATERSAGPDLIINNENGWIAEAGSSESILQIIENLIRQPEAIEVAGRKALESARQRPWVKYGDELAEATKKHLGLYSI